MMTWKQIEGSVSRRRKPSIVSNTADQLSKMTSDNGSLDLAV